MISDRPFNKAVVFTKNIDYYQKEHLQKSNRSQDSGEQRYETNESLDYQDVGQLARIQTEPVAEINGDANLTLFQRAIGLSSVNETRLNVRLKDLIGQRQRNDYASQSTYSLKELLKNKLQEENSKPGAADSTFSKQQNQNQKSLQSP